MGESHCQTVFFKTDISQTGKIITLGETKLRISGPRNLWNLGTYIYIYIYYEREKRTQLHFPTSLFRESLHSSGV